MWNKIFFSNTERRISTDICAKHGDINSTVASIVHSGVKPSMSSWQSSNQVCDAGLCGGRLAGSIWLIAPPWQWATLINGRPELFVCVFYAVCCVWGPRCRISMWEHEATAVTLTSAACRSHTFLHCRCTVAPTEEMFEYWKPFYCASSCMLYMLCKAVYSCP